MRRWCLHILPKGYTKTRRFGGYWNGHRDRYLAESRELLASEPAVSNLEAPTAEPESDTTMRCSISSSAVSEPPESLPAPRRIGIRAIRDDHSLAETSSTCFRRRTIPASVSTGLITPAKIQVTSCTLVDKLSVAAT